jgi:hypothetical protein
MDGILIAGILTSRLWYAVPLIVAVSLVYAATRHELMEPILRHALHTAVWIVGFMLVVGFVLFLLTFLGG